MEYVCEHCMDGTPFRAFISDNGKEGSCSFCNSSGKNVPVVAFGDLIERIQDEVRGQFEEYDSEYRDDEGEPVCRELDSYELLEEIGLRIDDGELLDRIEGHFSDCTWRRHDPMAPTEDVVRYSGWSSFCDVVKQFGKEAWKNRITPGRSEYDEEYLHVAFVPAILMETVRQLVVELPEDARIWRVQVLDEHEPPEIPRRFTSPPCPRQPNRMSPVGVSMFYGAEDLETAWEETASHSELSGKRVYGLQFQTVVSFYIVDLTSAFGEMHHEFYQKHPDRLYSSFLEEFARDVSQPIENDGKQHEEYLPTQVFTDVLRQTLKSDSGGSIQGMKYTSSKTGKPCYVIFADHSQCLDEPDHETGPQLLRAVPGTLTQCNEIPKKAE